MRYLPYYLIDEATKKEIIILRANMFWVLMLGIFHTSFHVMLIVTLWGWFCHFSNFAEKPRDLPHVARAYTQTHKVWTCNSFPLNMRLLIQMGREDSDSWNSSFVFTDGHKGRADTQSGSEKALHVGGRGRDDGEELWRVLVKCLILCWRGRRSSKISRMFPSEGDN